MSELAAKALKRLAGPGREPLLEVLAAWDSAVGERIAKVARPVRLSGGVVTVSVESPVWSQQLAMMAPSIVSALNEAIGKDTVRELRFSP
jgi:predicted nucleic acid-binding Zn ribbon protein